MAISRKLQVTFVAMGLATGGFMACGFLPLLGGQYALFVGTITGLAGLAIAGNVGSQFVNQKGITDQNVATVKAQAEAGQPVVQPTVQSPAPTVPLPDPEPLHEDPIPPG